MFESMQFSAYGILQNVFIGYFHTKISAQRSAMVRHQCATMCYCPSLAIYCVECMNKPWTNNKMGPNMSKQNSQKQTLGAEQHLIASKVCELLNCQLYAPNDCSKRRAPKTCPRTHDIIPHYFPTAMARWFTELPLLTGVLHETKWTKRRMACKLREKTQTQQKLQHV